MSEREGWGSTSLVIDSDVLIDHLRGCEVAMDFIDSLLFTRNVRHYPMTDIEVVAPYQP